MKNAFAVRSIECIGNFNGKGNRLITLEGTLLNQVLARNSLEQFRYDKRAATVCSPVMKRTNVVMAQCRCRLRLALESGQRLGGVGDILGHEFQRHEPV